MATSISVGPRYVLDETLGLQTGVTATNPNADNDIAYNTIPAALSAFLATLPAQSLGAAQTAFATANGAAHSTANLITITSGSPVAALTLNDSANGTLNGDSANGLQTTDGDNIYLWATSDPRIVLGRAGADSASSVTGAVVFAIYLEANAANTSATLYTVQFEAIKHPNGGTSYDEVVDLGNSLHIGATGDFNVNLGTLEAGQLYFGSFGDPDNGNPADDEIAVIVIAKDPSTDTINTSKAAGDVTIGVSSQQFKQGTGAYFTFVEGMEGISTSKGILLPAAGANNVPAAQAEIVYDNLVSAAGASITIVQIVGAGGHPTTNVQLTAWLTAEEQQAAFVAGLGIGGPAGDDDTQVKIDPASVHVFIGATEITSVIVTPDGLGVDVTGVPEGATIRYRTVDGVGQPAVHNRVLVENVDGNDFDIGGFGLLANPVYESIGQAIGFGDDGPTASAVATANTARTDESVGANALDTGVAPTDEVGHTPSSAILANQTLIGWAQASLANVSGGGFGTDGAGTKVVSLEVSAAGADSLLDTTDGISILLYKEGTVVIGRAGSAVGTAVFGIAMDANGLVTVEQYGSIDHLANSGPDQLASLANGVLFARVVMSDGDTDTNQAQVDIGPRIGFEDDAPTVDLALKPGVKIVIDASVGADTNDLVGTPATSDARADDETDSADPTDTGYALVLGTALFTVTEDIGEDQEGATFAYALNVDVAATALQTSAGLQAITLVEVNPVNGLATTVEGRFGANNASTAFRVTIDATSGNVTFALFEALHHLDPTLPDEKLLLGSGLLSAVRTLTDGDNDVASDSVDLGAIMSVEDDAPVIKPTLGTGEDLGPIANVVGANDSDNFDFDPGSDSNFTFTITDAPGDEDSAAPFPAGFSFRYNSAAHNSVTGKLDGVDLYTLTLDNAGNYVFTLLSAVPGSTTELDLLDIKAGGPDTNFIDVGTLSSTDFVRISGFFNGDPAAVNESHFNVGVTNGNLDGGESLEIKLISSDPDPDVIGDEVLVPITGISIGTKTPKETEYSWEAYLGANLVASDTSEFVGKNGTLTIDPAGTVTFDRVVVTSIDGNAVKIGLGDIVIFREPPDYVLNFDFLLTDADQDTTGADINVWIDGNGNGIQDAGAIVASLADSLELANLANAVIA